jgi:recombinational DNA repair protein RecT
MPTDQKASEEREAVAELRLRAAQARRLAAGLVTDGADWNRLRELTEELEVRADMLEGKSVV